VQDKCIHCCESFFSDDNGYVIIVTSEQCIHMLETFVLNELWHLPVIVNNIWCTDMEQSIYSLSFHEYTEYSVFPDVCSHMCSYCVTTDDNRAE
jgi:hypothetical protein